VEREGIAAPGRVLSVYRVEHRARRRVRHPSLHPQLLCPRAEEREVDHSPLSPPGEEGVGVRGVASSREQIAAADADIPRRCRLRSVRAGAEEAFPTTAAHLPIVSPARVSSACARPARLKVTALRCQIRPALAVPVRQDSAAQARQSVVSQPRVVVVAQVRRAVVAPVHTAVVCWDRRAGEGQDRQVVVAQVRREVVDRTYRGLVRRERSRPLRETAMQRVARGRMGAREQASSGAAF
jgi:hypothetical protein